MNRAFFESMHADCRTRRENHEDNTSVLHCLDHHLAFVYTRRTPVSVIPDNAIVFRGTYATSVIVPRDGKTLTKKGPWR